MPDKGFFNTSYNELAQKGILKTFVAIFDNQIIATRMVLCFNQTIYDWYAGASEKHMDKYPNDFLPWKIIEWGIENGYKTFDFGGAGKPGVPYGVRDFKMKFGGGLVEFGRFEKVHKPLLMKMGKFVMFIYKKIK
jgi:lipid II:glycine glycyltransferase (peptidoglycan interpeptide bridge formation enzyme)